mgnify:CR=1 FL=1
MIENLGGPRIIARTIVDAALIQKIVRTAMKLMAPERHRKQMITARAVSTVVPMAQ